MLDQHSPRSPIYGLNGLHDYSMLLSCVHDFFDAPVLGRHRFLERVCGMPSIARRLERKDGEVGNITYLFGLFFFHAQRLGDFYNRGSLPDYRRGFVLEDRQPADVHLHVFRNVNGAGVLGQGMGDGLADPPGHMGGDAEASAYIEFFNSPREPDIAFLDHIQER